MQPAALQSLAQLVLSRRVAALGTLREGAPFVSMVPYAIQADLGAFWLNLSQLAIHTRDIMADPRVSLMVAESDAADADPQTLARVSIQGTAEAVAEGSQEYDLARALYLSRFPDAATSFALKDFSLYRVVPSRGRYIAGFGEIYNITADHFRAAASAVR